MRWFKRKNKQTRINELEDLIENNEKRIFTLENSLKDKNKELKKLKKDNNEYLSKISDLNTLLKQKKESVKGLKERINELKQNKGLNDAIINTQEELITDKNKIIQDLKTQLNLFKKDNSENIFHNVSDTVNESDYDYLLKNENVVELNNQQKAMFNKNKSGIYGVRYDKRINSYRYKFTKPELETYQKSSVSLRELKRNIIYDGYPWIIIDDEKAKAFIKNTAAEKNNFKIYSNSTTGTYNISYRFNGRMFSLLSCHDKGFCEYMFGKINDYYNTNKVVQIYHRKKGKHIVKGYPFNVEIYSKKELKELYNKYKNKEEDEQYEYILRSENNVELSEKQKKRLHLNKSGIFHVYYANNRNKYCYKFGKQTYDDSLKKLKDAVIEKNLPWMVIDREKAKEFIKSTSEKIKQKQEKKQKKYSTIKFHNIVKNRDSFIFKGYYHGKLYALVNHSNEKFVEVIRDEIIDYYKNTGVVQIYKQKNGGTNDYPFKHEIKNKEDLDKKYEEYLEKNKTIEPVFYDEPKLINNYYYIRIKCDGKYHYLCGHKNKEFMKYLKTKIIKHYEETGFIRVYKINNYKKINYSFRYELCNKNDLNKEYKEYCSKHIDLDNLNTIIKKEKNGKYSLLINNYLPAIVSECNDKEFLEYIKEHLTKQMQDNKELIFYNDNKLILDINVDYVIKPLNELEKHYNNYLTSKHAYTWELDNYRNLVIAIDGEKSNVTLDRCNSIITYLMNSNIDNVTRTVEGAVLNFIQYDEEVVRMVCHNYMTGWFSDFMYTGRKLKKSEL